jgi:GMP synthase (glutamine-hydrolysing)
MTVRIHSFQHVPFEGLGCIEDWAAANRHAVTVTRFFQGDPFPAMEKLDWLIVMGGPMGVHDEREFPWLEQEQRFIGEAIEKGKRVLGICLGAQLLADVLGARVFRNPQKEIGWFPIELTEEAARNPIFGGLPQRFDVFHWHGDTFDLPCGATRIAASAACANQGFTYGPNVLALQFHLEITPAGLAALVEHCEGDLVPAPFVQTKETVLAGAVKFAEANEEMRQVLDGFSRFAVKNSREF